ncbi:MAG: hypothetical protein LQ346_000216 [Caloplaca aetnensis]|nr:MAG: hypothetical protein LQ346_000216 [Caloplaca aetnensis]
MVSITCELLRRNPAYPDRCHPGNTGTPLIRLLFRSLSIKHLFLPTTNIPRLQSQAPKSDRITILDGIIQNPAWMEERLIKRKIDTVKHLIYLSACGNLMRESVFDDKFGALIPGHVLVKAAMKQMLQQSKVFREKGRT